MFILQPLILLLCALQLVLTEPLQVQPSCNTSLSKLQLVHFYENETNKLSLQFCEKFKNISASILKDNVIQQAKTPAIRNFKTNITQFEEIYASYMGFGLNKQLLSRFVQITINYYYQDDKDSQYILQLLSAVGNDRVLDEFEKEFMNFVTTKFFNKFEEFKSQIPKNQTKNFQKLLNWGEELKKCQTYECFYKSFIQFDKLILTPKQHLFAYINKQLKEISLFYGMGALNISKSIIKSPKLPQLSDEVKQTLIQNLNKFIADYEKHNISQFNQILKFFHQNVLLEFYGNESMPLKEQQLLTDIFNEEGYAEFEKKYLKKFQDFVEIGLYKKFDNFKASLNKEGLAKEKDLIEWFNHLKKLITYEERNEALTKALFTFNAATRDELKVCTTSNTSFQGLLFSSLY